MCCASAALPPLPQKNSVPPRAHRSLHHRERRVELGPQLSAHVRAWRRASRSARGEAASQCDVDGIIGAADRCPRSERSCASEEQLAQLMQHAGAGSGGTGSRARRPAGARVVVREQLDVLRRRHAPRSQSRAIASDRASPWLSLREQVDEPRARAARARAARPRPSPSSAVASIWMTAPARRHSIDLLHGATAVALGMREHRHDCRSTRMRYSSSRRLGGTPPRGNSTSTARDPPSASCGARRSTPGCPA